MSLRELRDKRREREERVRAVKALSQCRSDPGSDGSFQSDDGSEALQRMSSRSTDFEASQARRSRRVRFADEMPATNSAVFSYDGESPESPESPESSTTAGLKPFQKLFARLGKRRPNMFTSASTSPARQDRDNIMVLSQHGPDRDNFMSLRQHGPTAAAASVWEPAPDAAVPCDATASEPVSEPARVEESVAIPKRPANARSHDLVERADFEQLHSEMRILSARLTCLRGSSPREVVMKQAARMDAAELQATISELSMLQVARRQTSSVGMEPLPSVSFGSARWQPANSTTLAETATRNSYHNPIMMILSCDF
eukprot:SAG31_NODE_10953_length_1079_cov_1.430612_1_plen_314_part_00